MRTRALRPLLCLSLTVLSLSACNAAAGTEAAEQAVARHHELYNAQRFEVIYHVADAELKQAVPGAGQFASVAQDFYRKLGRRPAASGRDSTWR
ncbi:MAG TPA: hypothetical protein VE871_12695 [Longimicrobium sp.]|nr:hypothetical protein [Longimicrobium sp.]